MYINELPTQKYLQECFIYDAENGKLYWASRPDDHFDTYGIKKLWDTSYTGKLAGMIKNGYMHVSINGKCYQNARIIWNWNMVKIH